MRNRKSGRKFGREIGPRKALLKGLASSLIECESIITTQAKAKDASSYVEKLITKAKKGNLASIKRINQELPEKSAMKIAKIAETRYKDRNGGYTRIINLGQRKTDSAKMAILELV